MTTEEKARAYDEALEDMRVVYPNLKGAAKLAVEHAFPELRESEDESTRKALIETVKCIYAGDTMLLSEQQRDRYLAYLEKQKEQKPAEWSEEDEKDMAHIIRILDDCYVYGTHDLSKTDYENLVNKLKSLRPQYHGDVTMTEAYKMGLEAGKASSWKPSEEDLMMLEHIIGQYEIGNKNSKVMGYLPRIEELDFLKKVLAKWKN